ncbi:MAG: substrate-binding domain-containing protein [Solirubrobacterales bacterium]|nr:substrate-binding domain-containing protein [Solirubrobacterales bacterium]
MNRSRLLASLTMATVAATPAIAEAKTTISMSGSTSIAPLARSLAKKYVGVNRNVSFKLLQGGSDTGINDAAKGRVTIGNAARDPQSSDPGGLVFNKIARDAVCMITNKANPIANLSQEQVQAIFTGRVRSWKDVPGARSTGAISLISRTAASGTGDAFKNIFLGPRLNVAASSSAKSSNGLVNQSVRSDKDAVGFVSLDFLSGVSAVGYKGVPCTLRNAKSGQYGGVRNFWMVTRGRAKGEAAKWIRWIQNSSAARRIINTDWISIR